MQARRSPCRTYESSLRVLVSYGPCGASLLFLRTRARLRLRVPRGLLFRW